MTTHQTLAGVAVAMEQSALGHGLHISHVDPLGTDESGHTVLENGARVTLLLRDNLRVVIQRDGIDTTAVLAGDWRPCDVAALLVGVAGLDVGP